MAYPVGIMGPPNSGKSRSREHFEDGLNVFLIQPSIKAPYLKDDGKPVQKFDVVTDNYKSLNEAAAALGLSSPYQVIKLWNQKLPPGSIKFQNVKGTVQLCKNFAELSDWAIFVSKHMPWIHTLVFADFTHFISKVISEKSFIERKAGGEAYQRLIFVAPHE